MNAPSSDAMLDLVLRLPRHRRRCRARSDGLCDGGVGGRAFFPHPIPGNIELVQLGCAVVVASFLPHTQHPTDTFGTRLHTIVMAVILWRVAIGGIDVTAAGARFMLMDIPLWSR